MDIDLNWGGQMSLSPTGDIALVSGTVAGQQRVLRRLLTNEGDYLWHLNYGAGLPQMIGQIVNQGEMEGIILSQMRLEEAVDQTVPPTVAVASANDGTVYAEVLYVDSTTNERSVLTLPL